MLPPIHVPSSTAGLAITALQCMNLLAFANERQNPTGYSKFADGKSAKDAISLTGPRMPPTVRDFKTIAELLS